MFVVMAMPRAVDFHDQLRGILERSDEIEDFVHLGITINLEPLVPKGARYNATRLPLILFCSCGGRRDQSNLGHLQRGDTAAWQ